MCVKSIIHVNFCYDRAQTALSEVQSYKTPLTLVESQAPPRSFLPYYESNAVSQQLLRYSNLCHSTVRTQPLLSSLFPIPNLFPPLSTALHWLDPAVLLSGSYNIHPLMTLEDAPGSAEFTVTGLQGKSCTFLCVSLVKVWNTSPWVCLESLHITTINWLPLEDYFSRAHTWAEMNLCCGQSKKKKGMWEGCKVTPQVRTGKKPTEWRGAQEIRGNRPCCQQTVRARNTFKDREMAADSFP